MSSGRAMRPIGLASAMRAFVSGGQPRLRSVSVALGRTRFARTFGAHAPASAERQRVEGRLGHGVGQVDRELGRHDPTDEMLMIDPPSPSAIRSPTSTLRRNGPLALVGVHLVVEVLAHRREAVVGGRHARVVHQHVAPPELADRPRRRGGRSPPTGRRGTRSGTARRPVAASISRAAASQIVAACGWQSTTSAPADARPSAMARPMPRLPAGHQGDLAAQVERALPVSSWAPPVRPHARDPVPAPGALRRSGARLGPRRRIRKRLEVLCGSSESQPRRRRPENLVGPAGERPCPCGWPRRAWPGDRRGGDAAARGPAPPDRRRRPSRTPCRSRASRRAPASPSAGRPTGASPWIRPKLIPSASATSRRRSLSSTRSPMDRPGQPAPTSGVVAAASGPSPVLAHQAAPRGRPERLGVQLRPRSLRADSSARARRGHDAQHEHDRPHPARTHQPACVASANPDPTPRSRPST